MPVICPGSPHIRKNNIKHRRSQDAVGAQEVVACGPANILTCRFSVPKHCRWLITDGWWLMIDDYGRRYYDVYAPLSSSSFSFIVQAALVRRGSLTNASCVLLWFSLPCFAMRCVAFTACRDAFGEAGCCWKMCCSTKKPTTGEQFRWPNRWVLMNVTAFYIPRQRDGTTPRVVHNNR